MSASREELEKAIDSLPPHELLLLDWDIRWTRKARRKQVPPDDNSWGIYGIRAGRGFGKTEAGANWLGLKAARDNGSFNFVIAPTFDDVKETCFEGPTGLVAAIPPQLIVHQDRGLPSITLWNGSFIRGFAAATPERLRGPQCHRGWLDEIASWRRPKEAWNNYRFGLRLGSRPQTVWTSTLKPTPFIRDLLKKPRSIIVQGSTYENRANLAPDFFGDIGQYEGTAIGRQELYGELLDPGENGFVKKSQWRRWPSNQPLPVFRYIIYSLDTAFTDKDFNKKEQENDPTACSVWGVFELDGKTNVLLLDCWQEWLGFPALIQRVKTERKRTYGAPDLMLADERGPLYGQPLYGNKKQMSGKEIDLLLIEEKASGISLRQVLASEEILTEGYNPGKADKLTRLHRVSPLFSNGRVWAVESNQREGEFRDWAEPLIEQVCSFVGEGSLEHDDLLDSATQALKYVADRFIGALTKAPKTKAQLLQEAIEGQPRRMVNSYYG